jgi:hypothetical protein
MEVYIVGLIGVLDSGHMERVTDSLFRRVLCKFSYRLYIPRSGPCDDRLGGARDVSEAVDL